MTDLERAKDPNTPPEQLATLLNDSDDIVANVAANPALPLLVLAEPSWFLKLSSQSLGRLLACESLPESVVRALMLHPSRTIRFAAEHHISVAGEPGTNWQDDMWDYLGQCRIINKPLLLTYISQGKVPSPLLERLVGCDDAAIRAAVVRHAPALPLVRLLQRASGSALLHKIVVPDPTLTEAEQAVLTRHVGRFAKRVAVAQPTLPAALLAELADEPDLFLKIQVARHPNTSAATRTQLAALNIPALNTALARTDRVIYTAPRSRPAKTIRPPRNTPHQRRVATAFLSNKPEVPILYVPPRTLLQRVVDRLSAGDLIFTPPTDDPTLEHRYHQLSVAVRVSLGRRHDLPPAVRNLCANDEVLAVRKALAKNPTTPPTPKTTPKQSTNSYTPPYDWSALNHSGSLLRFLYLMNLTSLPHLSDYFVRPSHWLNRLALALHRPLAARDQDTLLRDGHTWVRAAARDQSQSLDNS